MTSNIYSILGIRLLKRIIMETIGKFVLLVNPREKMPSYFIGKPFSRDSLLLTLKWLYFNEAVHVFLTFFSIGFGYFCMVKGYKSGVVIMIIMIFLNIGLALMQRMNRNRIRLTIRALDGRKNNH